jgi:hypothetical protein
LIISDNLHLECSSTELIELLCFAHISWLSKRNCLVTCKIAKENFDVKMLTDIFLVSLQFYYIFTVSKISLAFELNKKGETIKSVELFHCKIINKSRRLPIVQRRTSF